MSVLLRKPRVYAEIYNDLDGELINLFRVLRDPAQGSWLVQLVELTPFGREEFVGAYKRTRDPVERARRLLVRSFMGFGSAATYMGHRTGFRANSSRSGTTPAHDWRTYPAILVEIIERLQGVVIENRDFAAIVAQHDSPETLVYADPPYPHSTRTFRRRASGQVYHHEMSDADHRRMAEVLRGLRSMVVVSGYACDLYDRDLFPDWMRVTSETFADGARPRTEVLWLNEAAAMAQMQRPLFGSASA